MENTEDLIINGDQYVSRLETKDYDEFKKKISSLGIKEINIHNGSLSESSFSEKLRIYFSPNYSNMPLFNNRLSQSLKDKLNEMGIEYYDDIASPTFTDDNIIGIIYKETIIGHYLPNRNIIIIYFFMWGRDYVDKGLTKLMTNHIIEELKKINLKEIDTKAFVKEHLVQKFIKSITERKSNLRNEIINTENNMIGYFEKIARSKNELIQKKEEHKSLFGIVGNMTKELEKRIEEIKILPFVKRVGLSQRGIRIDFKHIDLNWKGKKIELGECYTYLLGDTIKILNKTPITHDGSIYHSPHVEGKDGDKICFGDASEKVYSMLGEMKFRGVVHMIYLFLKTFTEDDNYCSMGNWELCKQQKDGIYMSNDYRRSNGMELLEDSPEDDENDEDDEEDDGEYNEDGDGL